MPHNNEDETLPRILFLDAYDSFTNNIIALLKCQIACDVHVVKIDDPRYLKNNDGHFKELLRCFDAVVAGPGPGSPTNETDVGLIGKIWGLPDEDLVPVLGICLGFQSLACAFGARVERLLQPRHGVIQRIIHCQRSIFSNAGEIFATQYHSLRVQLRQPDHSANSANSNQDMWASSSSCPELLPLAWVVDDVDNGSTLMGVRHVTKPFWAVQFHPESVCTNDEGNYILQNWWSETRFWMRRRGSRVRRPPNSTSLLELTWHESVPARPEISLKSAISHCTTRSDRQVGEVHWKSISLAGLQVTSICESLKLKGDELLLLESGTLATGKPVNAETGRFSIIANMVPGETEHLQYNVSTGRLSRLKSCKGKLRLLDQEVVSDIWAYMAQFMETRKVEVGPKTTPFWGGLVGYVSYEACLKNINIVSTTKNRPDMWFTFVERSLIIDHVEKQIYVQSIRRDDNSWITQIAQLLKRTSILKQEKAGGIQDHMEVPCIGSGKGALACLREYPRSSPDSSSHTNLANIRGPRGEDYRRKVRQCQARIRAGDSYELCMTDQTKVTLKVQPQSLLSTSWSLYRRLRQINPAPFAAYLRLETEEQGIQILSSSPERFLSWDRTGRCQFRPIKGTVKKSPDMTRARAEEILHSSKEQAENLMIVDLIRHDLYGVVGAGNVHVEKLMSVEEYETVYQLVSVIGGQLPRDRSQSGIDVIAASLPPGSMTGAPKHRSCEILQHVEEEKPRGIYSGVLGYLDVGGGGDFSVIIRTAFRWDDDIAGAGTPDEKPDHHIWHVGAGGAVTSQSTDVGEWEEMLAKRDPLLRMFDEID